MTEGGKVSVEGTEDVTTMRRRRHKITVVSSMTLYRAYKDTQDENSTIFFVFFRFLFFVWFFPFSFDAENELWHYGMELGKPGGQEEDPWGAAKIMKMTTAMTPRKQRQ